MVNIDYHLEPGRTLRPHRQFEKHDPVISIVTPSWNPSDKIFQLANCILNQTYPYLNLKRNPQLSIWPYSFLLPL